MFASVFKYYNIEASGGAGAQASVRKRDRVRFPLKEMKYLIF